MREFLVQADVVLRIALEEIENTVRRIVPGVECLSIEVEEGGWIVGYFNPDSGCGCLVHVATLNDACDAIVAHIARLREARAQRDAERVESRRFTTSNKAGECVLCHSTEEIHEHHIRPRSKYPELAHEKSNIVPLCAPCHRKTYGREEQYIAVLEAAVGA